MDVTSWGNNGQIRPTADLGPLVEKTWIFTVDILGDCSKNIFEHGVEKFRYFCVPQGYMQTLNYNFADNYRRKLYRHCIYIWNFDVIKYFHPIISFASCKVRISELFLWHFACHHRQHFFSFFPSFFSLCFFFVFTLWVFHSLYFENIFHHTFAQLKSPLRYKLC